MSNRARRREALLWQSEATRKNRLAARRRLWLAGVVFIGASVASVAAIFVTARKDSIAPITAASPSVPLIPANPSGNALNITNPAFPTLVKIMGMSPEELAKVDIAVVNLRCAEGMPGAEKIDIAATLRQIDAMAARVKHETEAYAYNLDRHPERYGGVMGKYEMDMLTTVLQQDFNIHYDPAMAALEGKEGTPEDTFYDDARNLFINGLTERQMGTCSNLPVLYAAVARRLGYPVYLADASAHLYLKWIEGSTKFNIEATSAGGLNEESDDYYKHWPFPVTPQAEEEFHYFQPMSARDELASFLSMRSQMLLTQRQWIPAIRCQMKAVELSEHNKVGMNLQLAAFKQIWAQNQAEQMDALLDQRDHTQDFHPQSEIRSNQVTINAHPVPSDP
jgi:hypothetical protein